MRFQISLLTMLLLSANLCLYAEQAVDAPTVLKIDDGVEAVKTYCLECHSSQLIIQHSATPEGWRDTIRSMYEIHGLRPLKPETEKRILNYLSENYAPRVRGRRVPLTTKDWYLLDLH